MSTFSSNAPGTTRCELDSHADTSAFGNDCHIVRVHSNNVSVSGFHSDLPAIPKVSIVDLAVAYDCPYTFTTYILFFNQVLLIPGLNHHLINPDQLREHGVTVNDIPLIRIPPDQRSINSHCILLPDSDLRIPLSFSKPISYFVTRKPTQSEVFDSLNHNHVELTSSLEWSPYDHTSTTDESQLRERVERHAYSLTTFPLPVSELAQITSALDPLSLFAGLGDNYASSTVSEVSTSGRSSLVTPTQLARRWRCSIDVAKRTLETTTQRAMHDYTNLVGGRRIRPTQYQLRYPRLSRELYCDIWHGPCTSLEGNKFAVVYAASCQWSRVFPIRKKEESHLSLDRLFRAIGFPEAIVPDYAKELTLGKFLRKAQQAQVAIHPIEPYMHNLRPAEDCIRELVRLYSRTMVAMNVPAPLWDRCMIWVAEIRSHMNLGHPEQGGQVGATCITGTTRDVSHIANFGFYEWIWYHTPKETGEPTRMRLGRWCGPSFDVGDVLCNAVLNSKGSILHKTSVFPLKPEETSSEEIKQMKHDWDMELKAKLGDRVKGLTESDIESDKYFRPHWDPVIPEYQKYEDLDKPAEDTFEPPPDIETADPAEIDRWTSARIRTMRGDTPVLGTVKGRKRGPDGEFIGTWESNPILDTSVYEVELDDGSIECYLANQIAEEIYQRVDDDGYLVDEIKDIVDHKKDASAVAGDDSFVDVRGQRKLRRTTKGWKLLVEWKSGDSSWESLADLKEAYPVKVAEYALGRKIMTEPAFAWWAPHVLKKKDRILKMLQKRIVKRKNEKFGIEVPKPMDVKRALEIDRETGTDHWAKAMKKEVGTVFPALRVLEDGENVPVGSQFVDLMMIFDVKMDLTRKARLVARGDQVETPSNLTYASVVSRDSIRIALLLSALNGVSLLAADVAGAYLNAPCRERVHTVLGPAFGELQGKTAVIVKSLYGLNSGGFSWRSYCADILRNNLGWKSCRADADVWLRPAVKSNGDSYYEYLLIHTDDLLCVSDKGKEALDEINGYFLLKPESVGEPSTYLGGQISKYYIDGDPKHKWAYGSEKYIKEALRVIKKKLDERGMSLKLKARSVLPSGYKPELDATDTLDSDDASFYMQAIGILRWIVELGRVDICCEVSMMAAYNACPRVGHMESVMHIFSYLSCHERSRLVFDDAYADHPMPEKAEWHEFYPDATDLIPPDMPEPRGKPVQITMFVDASHAANVVTRQSRTGVLIYCNMSLIIWHSKKQNSIETSTFGSEFMALKTGFELLEALRYKLRMMGVPLDGPAMVKVDNMSVVKNTSVPESMLKKKSNSIAYHYVREKCAADIARVGYEPTDTNLADMLTKSQPGPKRAEQAKMILR